MIETNRLNLTITLLLLLFYSTIGYSQKNVVIEGNIEGYETGESLTYYLPINGYSNYDYSRATPILNDKGHFKINANLDSSGFIILEPKGRRIFLYIEESGKFELNAKTTQDNHFQNRLNISGRDSAGQLIYNEEYGNFQINEFVNKILETKYHAKTDIYKYVDSSLLVFLGPLNKLYKKNKISDRFYRIIASDVRYVIYWKILSVLSQIQEDNPWMTNRDINVFKDQVYHPIVTKDDYLLKSNFGYFIFYKLVSDYSSLGYDDKYAMIDSFYFKNGGTYKEAGRFSFQRAEMFWGHVLYVSALLHTDDFNFDSVFKYYISQYPNSGFIPVIRSLLKDQGSNNSNNLAKTDESKIHVIDSSLINMPLDKFIKANFYGRYVFVDLWATWCMPCIGEFKYNAKTDSLLSTLDVTKLYVTIDDSLFTKKWHNDIYQFGLKGNHIMAGKELQQLLAQSIYFDENNQISIPRYLLFDKNGDLIDRNLPRPSSYDDLSDKLKKYTQP